MNKPRPRDYIDVLIEPVKTTERQIFGEILRDCDRGLAAIRKTNDRPTEDNIAKETDILKEIICA